MTKAALAGSILFLAAFSLLFAPIEVQAQDPAAQVEGEKQAEKARGPRTGLEIGLSGALILLNTTPKSRGQISWSGNLVSAAERGGIDILLENPLGFSASLAYFISPALGICLEADIPNTQSFDIADASFYEVAWFSDKTHGQVPGGWRATGHFSVTAFSLDLIWRFFRRPTFDAYLKAGPSFYTGKFDAVTKYGLGWSWADRLGDFDYFPVDISISEKIEQIDFNLGAGFDIRLGNTFIIFGEIGLFHGRKVPGNWVLQPGIYQGAIVTTDTLNLTPAEIEAIDFTANMKNLSPVRPFFTKLALGVKVAL